MDGHRKASKAVLGLRGNRGAPRRAVAAALRGLSSKILEAQETERRRVARELHDSVNQCLSSVAFRLKVLEEKWAGKEEESWREILKCKALVENAIGEVRRISHNLRPSELDELGIGPAVRSLIGEFTERTGIKVEAVLSEGAIKLGGATELQVYRIVQEALTNVGRHALARCVLIGIEVNGMGLKAIIRDDGRGFDQKKKPRNKQGLGLIHMNERAMCMGGTCMIKSSPGKGTEVTVRIPLANKPYRRIER